MSVSNVSTTYGSPTRTANLVGNQTVSYVNEAGNTVTVTTGTAGYDKLYGAQGALSPRTQQYVLAKLLTRGRENIIIDKFCQTIPIPKGNGKRIIARRYKNLAPATTALTEGTTPDAQTITCEDVTGTLTQYGGVMEITDQIQDFYDDPILNIMSELAGEQAADTAEALNWDIIKSGTNEILCGASATVNTKEDVAGPVGKYALVKAERILRRNNARFITSMLSASPKISTEPIPSCYVILSHTDSKGMWENMTGYVPVEKYASGSAINDNEIGKIGAFRIILSNNFKMEEDAGVAVTTGSSGNNLWSGGGATVGTSSDNADVYWAVVLSKDAVALTPLAGMEAAKFYVCNPTATVYDPLAQKGTVGWKMYHGGMILNDSWIIKIGYALSDTAVTPSDN